MRQSVWGCCLLGSPVNTWGSCICKRCYRHATSQWLRLLLVHWETVRSAVIIVLLLYAYGRQRCVGIRVSTIVRLAMRTETRSMRVRVAKWWEWVYWAGTGGLNVHWLRWGWGCKVRCRRIVCRLVRPQ